MHEPADDAVPPPLPREWLPEPAPADATEWQVRLERVVVLAEPALRDLAARAESGTPWPLTLGTWWRPAAALAAVAAALLLVIDTPAARPPATRGSLPLGVMAADGQPVGLWEGLGIEADPVLALMTMLDQQ